MNLKNIIRRKFLPPKSTERNNPYKHSFHDKVSYGVKLYKEKFIPWIKLYGEGSDEIYAYSYKGSFSESLIKDSISFETAEEANEFCWDNFSEHYKEDIVSKVDCEA